MQTQELHSQAAWIVYLDHHDPGGVEQEASLELDLVGIVRGSKDHVSVSVKPARL
jgi:hypothetical protein